MVDEPLGDRRGGVHHEEPVGAVRAEDAAQIAPELERVLDVTVRIPQPHDISRTDDLGGLLRLHAPDLGEPLPHHVSVLGSGRPIGDDADRQLRALVHPSRERPRGSELEIVGVSRDRQHPVTRWGHPVLTTSTSVGG